MKKTKQESIDLNLEKTKIENCLKTINACMLTPLYIMIIQKKLIEFEFFYLVTMYLRDMKPVMQ
jgi:hypothetical protein